MRKLWQRVCCFILVLSVWLMMGCSSEKCDEEFEAIEVSGEESKDEYDLEPEDSPEEASVIWVYVCGAVCDPGVYELEAHSRVYEAIEAAGGMTETAASSYLNQAEQLSDGQKIYVPSEDEAAWGQGVNSGEQTVGDGKIDINAATKEELMSLNGIGEVRAQAIIDYREKHGGFNSVEELKEVEGIKDGVFNKLKDLIKVS